MSLDLRLQTVDAALPDARPDSDSLPDAMSDEPGVGWHLARCPHCGVPNGLSATSCWGCEADLSAIERFHLDRAPPSDAWMREQASESLALLPSPAQTHVPEPALPVPETAMPTDGPRRYTRAIGSTILGIALAGMTAFLHFSTVPSGDASKSVGWVDEPDSLARAKGVVSPTVQVEPIPRVDAIKPVEPVPMPVATPAAATPAVPAASPTTPQETTAAPRATGRSHSASRSANAATALPAAGFHKPEPIPQAPALRGPCTATIAALGLCSAPAAESKE